MGNRIQEPGVCGDPTTQGQKATGEPIKIGAITTDIPGVVWKPIPAGATAYFDCVNDNGGIGGRPIDYTIVNDQGDGNASRQAALKLLEDDKRARTWSAARARRTARSTTSTTRRTATT